MPKPPGTYVAVRKTDRIAYSANRDKQAIAIARRKDLSAFERAVDARALPELEAGRNYMAVLMDNIKKGEPTAESDRTRKKVAALVADARGMLERAQDYKQLEGRLQAPVYPVMAAPANLGSTGAGLALIIATCQVFEGLVRLRKRREPESKE